MARTELGCLGILTGRDAHAFPAGESAFCDALCRAAPAFGLRAVVFTPDGVSPDGSAVTGCAWEGETWGEVRSAAPDIVYNRLFYRNPEEWLRASRALGALKGSLPLTRGLPDKWRVYEILRQSPPAAPLLPETRLYTGPRGLKRMLAEREDGIFLKPRAGMQGKRSLHASRPEDAPSGLTVRGRDGDNRPLLRRFGDLESGLGWIENFIGRQGFVMQRFLKLTASGGEPFDIRVLVQKDGRGRWGVTGMAARLGARGSLTSNLHGGGTAARADRFLRVQYGGSAAERIMRDLREAAALLPPLLEASCGRLGELGLDFGVDPAGRIWLLEANSKPGRTAFTLTGDTEAARRSAENPLSYARYLLLANRRSPVPPQAGALHPEDRNLRCLRRIL